MPTMGSSIQTQISMPRPMPIPIPIPILTQIIITITIIFRRGHQSPSTQQIPTSSYRTVNNSSTHQKRSLKNWKQNKRKAYRKFNI